MEWISVEERLPTYTDENNIKRPSYNYVIIWDGKRKYSIARLIENNKWEFLSTYDSGEGISAYCGDLEMDMTIDEIKFWKEFN